MAFLAIGMCFWFCVAGVGEVLLVGCDVVAEVSKDVSFLCAMSSSDWADIFGGDDMLQ